MSGSQADVKEIFLGALDCATPQDVVRFLDDACAGDAALRTHIEDLLRARCEAGDFLGGGWSPAPPGLVPPDEAPGAVIGPYKLLEQIGEGGFGVVFRAEQQRPVRRDVALKIIKLGMDTRQVVARFEAERQALAMMDHPGIAKVFDAGTTDSGRPYFVMELVRGVPITDFCDERRLGIEQRLNLFVQVCQAVQHAHQKGLIHRDIKPSNVLVAATDSWPTAKVIDFGIAKATQSRLTDKTLVTDLRQLIGTPEYMSPEQAGGSQDVDTRSDVYSLGVLLYELLTGAPPFDPKELRSKAFAEVQRIIREVEPLKPSTRLSTMKDKLPSVAAQRATEPRRLDSVVRGDLDWITMKALEKDRGRRYESAAALAADVMHHLADEPVSAAAPSRVYRIGKFVHRNKLSVIASSAVVVTLLAGIVGTTIGLIGQARQRAEAEAAKEQLQAVNSFLTDDVIAGADPSRLPDKEVRDQIVHAMIDPAAATVAERFKDTPLVEAAVRAALADAYEILGRNDLALPHARRALAIRRRELGPAHPEVLASAIDLGNILRALGRPDEAEPLLLDALDRMRRAAATEDEGLILALTSVAILRQEQGRFEEAEPLYREALERSRPALGNDHELTIMSINNLGYVLLMQGQIVAAGPFVEEAFERTQRVLGENHRGAIRAIDNMGLLMFRQGRFGEAEKHWQRGLELCRRVLGSDDPYSLDAANNMASLWMELGRFEDAEPLVRDVLRRRRRVLGRNHPATLASLNNLSFFLRRWGKLDEAETVAEEALERIRAVRGDEHPDTLYILTNLGSVYLAQKRFREAEPFFLEALETCERTLPENHLLRSIAIFDLGELRHLQDRFDEARHLYEQALDLRRRTLGDANLETVYVYHSLAILRHMQGQAEQALPMFRQVLAAYEESFGPDHWQVGVAHMHVGRCLTNLQQYHDAELELLEADRVLGASASLDEERNQRLCEDFVALYEARAQAQPDGGFDAKATAWRERLAAGNSRDPSPAGE